MKGFIEVTENESGLKVLCPVSKILSVLCGENDIVFIETGFDGSAESSGIEIRETFDEVKQKLDLVVLY